MKQSSPEQELTTGLYLVSTPIGNLEDITLRALRILKQVDQIAAEDTRSAFKLMNAYEFRKPVFSLYRDNEQGRIPQVIEALSEGKSIALISEAGTPAISDPGYLLTKAVIEAGYKVHPIPGATAVTSALIGSGLPSDRFLFLGFLPPKKSKRKALLEQYAHIPITLILYVSPHQVIKQLEEIQELLGDREACIARELTKVYEEYIRGTFSEILDNLRKKERCRGEFVLVIKGCSQEEQYQPLAPNSNSSQDQKIEDAIKALLQEDLTHSRRAKRLRKQFPHLTRKESYQLLLGQQEPSTI